MQVKDSYLDTINRLEPEIVMIDIGTYNASAAISLKRIADALEYHNKLYANSLFGQKIAPNHSGDNSYK